MDDRPFKIVATWAIGFAAILFYFTTDLFILSWVILFLAIPLRSGLYEEDTLRGAIREMPILSAICASWIFGLACFYLYKFSETQRSDVFSLATISLIFFPLLVLYLLRDISLYRRIKAESRK